MAKSKKPIIDSDNGGSDDDYGPSSAQGMIDSAPTTGGKGNYLKLPEGVKLFAPRKNQTYRLIFLPWKAGSHNPAGTQGEWVTNRYLPIHKNFGPNEENFLCSQKALGKSCAACEFFLNQKQAQRDWDSIKDLRPKDREMFLVHDLDGEKDNVLVWEESIHLFGNYLRDKISMRKKYQVFAHLKNGMVVLVKGKEKSMGVGTCTEFPSIDMEDREEGMVTPALIRASKTLCPDDWVLETPYAKLKKLVSSATVSDDEDEPEEPSDVDDSDDESEEEEPEEKSVARKSVKPGSKKEEPEEEEEDEPEEPSDVDDEDEDDDLEEPEPEPEPAPKKPGRKSPKK